MGVLAVGEWIGAAWDESRISADASASEPDILGLDLRNLFTQRIVFQCSRGNCLQVALYLLEGLTEFILNKIGVVVNLKGLDCVIYSIFSSVYVLSVSFLTHDKLI